jgi:branched-subunit amino acid aminotransferase/4-amino-4-deoxychorismate lyase
MKGTRPRGRWPAADQALAQELAASEKERAENVMIVDLLRNDLTKISEAGSVQAGPLYEVEAYPTVWQMTSTIRSRTRAAVPEIMGALFPSGSVTGAPKIRTMEIIRELEPFPRGIYCGTIGWWAPDGRAEFNVAIRTVIVDTHAGQASYQVGSGITYGSAAEDEYAECLVKAALLTRRMPAFDLLETLRYDGAYVLLAEHLERLAASARYFGFACDRPAIEHALLAAAARETAVGKDGMKSVPLPQPLAPDSSKEGTRQETHPRPLQGGEMTQFISEEESRIYSTSPEARGCDHTASNITEPDTSPSLPGRDFLPPLPGGAGGGSSSSTQPANLAGRKVRLLLRKDGSFTIQQEPLPASNPLKVGFAVQPVDMNDILLYHKTTGRDIYRQALAARPDCDDVLLWNARDEITESTLANVVLELEDGRWTPPLASGLLGGTFRRHLLAQGAIAERVLTKADARRARAMHLINSVRGWIPVRWLDAARP